MDHKLVKTNYSVSIDVTISRDQVFSHLIHDIPKFWPEDFKGESSKLNDEFIFTSEGGHYSKNKIAELVPNEKVVWLVTESIRPTDNFDWTGTKMIFELSPLDNGTQIEFTYDGFIFDHEYDRLVQICDIVIKDMLYNFLTH